MRTFMSGICMTVLLVPAVWAQGFTQPDAVTGYQEITILDNGVQRKRYMLQPNTESKMGTLAADTNTTRNISKKGIIVAFKKGTKVDVERFAATYGLKLKKKLVTGYYIFENVSDQDDAVILSRIMKEEKGLRTLKPNWEKNNRPR